MGPTSNKFKSRPGLLPLHDRRPLPARMLNFLHHIGAVARHAAICDLTDLKAAFCGARIRLQTWIEHMAALSFVLWGMYGHVYLPQWEWIEQPAQSIGFIILGRFLFALCHVMCKGLGLQRWLFGRLASKQFAHVTTHFVLSFGSVGSTFTKLRSTYP